VPESTAITSTIGRRSIELRVASEKEGEATCGGALAEGKTVDVVAVRTEEQDASILAEGSRS
jgi:hypothetical protein